MSDGGPDNRAAQALSRRGRAPLEVEIDRFPVDADQDSKRNFGRLLLTALDELGVKPGDSFVVTKRDYIDYLERESEDLRDKFDDLIANTAEEASKAEAYDELVEGLRDVERGIKDLPEVMRDL